VVLTGIALAIFGAVKGKLTGISMVKSAVQTTLVGGVAAAAAFYLDRFLVDVRPDQICDAAFSALWRGAGGWIMFPVLDCRADRSRSSGLAINSTKTIINLNRDCRY